MRLAGRSEAHGPDVQITFSALSSPLKGFIWGLSHSQPALGAAGTAAAAGAGGAGAGAGGGGGGVLPRLRLLFLPAGCCLFMSSSRFSPFNHS